MLTEGEKNGIKAILSLLNPKDLLSLAATSTKNQIVIPDIKECVNAILAFTETPKDFLSRRVCSKALLTNYAYKEGLPVNSKLSKDDIVRLILGHWSGSSVLPSSMDHQPLLPSGCSLVSHNQENSACLREPHVSVHINPTFNINFIGKEPSAMSDTEKKFGYQFTHWFYDILNHSDPVSQGFCPDNFLAEAELKIIHVSPETNNEHTAKGREEVAYHILGLFNNYSLQPNLSENGIIVKSDPHGLRIILVSGTLYKMSSLRGIFEQSFGLAQDPHVANNWKIRFTELHLKEN